MYRELISQPVNSRKTIEKTQLDYEFDNSVESVSVPYGSIWKYMDYVVFYVENHILAGVLDSPVTRTRMGAHTRTRFLLEKLTQ